MRSNQHLLAAFLVAAALHVLAGLCMERLLSSRTRQRPLFKDGESCVLLTLVAAQNAIPKPVRRIEEAELLDTVGDVAEEPSTDCIIPIPLPGVPALTVPPPTITPRMTEPSGDTKSSSAKEDVPERRETDVDLNDEGEKENDADMLRKGTELFAAGITEIRPHYPLRSRRRGEEGMVVLRVTIGANGRARDVGVATSSGFAALDRSAVDAVRSARFATSGNRNGYGTVLLTFDFKLTD